MITDIMVDTEFLSLTYDSHILSIGVVGWDIDQEFKVEDSLHMFPSMESQTTFGAKVDQGTFQWWLGQSDEARKAIIEGQRVSKTSIQTCLLKLSIFFAIRKSTLQRVWSHGSVCDLPLLKHWCDKVDMRTPWHYQAPRDTRTLFDTVGFTPKRDYTKSVAHDALADAVAQAQQVHEAWKLRRLV